MITGVHTMFYTSQAEQLRAFLRDVLQLPFTDVGEGWLIFDLPEAEMGCHTADEGRGSHSGLHDISFYCDDIGATVTELAARGVHFTHGIEDRGYGLVTTFLMPGDVRVQLYQPRYVKNVKEVKVLETPKASPKARAKPGKAKAAKKATKVPKVAMAKKKAAPNKRKAKGPARR